MRDKDTEQDQNRNPATDSTGTSSNHGASRTARPRRGLKPPRWLLIVVAAIAAVVVGALVINELTPRPFVAVFRVLIGQVDDQVKLGPYADQVADVQVSDPIRVPVEGAPDAELTMYTNGQVPDGTGGTGGTGGSDETNGGSAGMDGGKPLILFVHGGGWVVGEASQIGSFSKLLASNDFVVASLDYSLAPEHTYPTPIRQTAAALGYLQTHAGDFGADRTKVFIGGNSAGAQIASQMGSLVSDPNYADQVGIDPQMPASSLKGLTLFNGVYDFDTVGRDGFPGFSTYAWSYTGVKDYTSYSRIDELSTTRTATAAYPATFMTAGDADPLEPQTYQLDAVLRAKGVDVTSLYWTGSNEDLPHDYIFDLTKKPAQVAYQEAVEFIRSRLS